MTVPVEHPLQPLVTPAAVAARTGMSLEDAGQAAAGVSAAIRAWAGWHIAPVITQTLVLDGTGYRELLVPTLKVTALHSCTCDGTVLDTDSLEWSRAGMLRHPSGCWPDRYGSVILTLEHGFPDAPDVEAEAMTLIQARAGNPLGYTSRTLGPASWTMADGGDASRVMTRRLSRYRVETAP